MVNDGSSDSEPVTVTVTVTPVSDKPVAAAQDISTDEDTDKIITLTATDPDGDTGFTYAVVSNPSHGTLMEHNTMSGETVNMTYTPNANYNGSDSFTFKVSDPRTRSGKIKRG